MKPKPLAITVAVLAVLSVLAWYLQRPPAGPPPDPRVGHDLLATKTLAAAAKIRLTDGSKTVVLTKQPDGKWTDSSYYDLPVDFSKLSRFTGDLTSTKIQRLVTRRPDVMARLDFKHTSVTLFDGQGKDLWELTLGKEADSGGRFVKYGKETRAYLANLNVYLDTDPKNWADSLLVNLKSHDIAAVDIGFAAGKSVTVSRPKASAPWVSAQTPAGHQVKADAITDLLSSLTSLRFEKTSGLTDPEVSAARAHARTVTLTTFKHQVVTIALGRKPEKKVPEPPAKTAAKPKPEAAKAGAKAKPKEAKPAEKTIPAGPVYAFVQDSNPKAPINALMKRRAFQVYDWNYTSLPKDEAALFEAVPAAPAASKKTGSKPAPTASSHKATKTTKAPAKA